jgi:serine/threonine-protein kinase
MALEPGSRIGPYQVTAQIGQGGMGEVYRATDTILKRSVAVKVLPEAVASDRDRLARFQREAEVLAALNHPNVAQIFGLERSDGVTALVMELVEGRTLADRIAEGPVPVDEVLPIAKQIADALEAAHEQGIVHRDLKPANVKLRDDGAVKVLDFGLAKASDPLPANASGLTQAPTITSPAMTQIGVILGTAAYMSPEQARGKAVDKRADIWAFGCVLYEMLTGARAFEAEDVSLTLSRVLQGEPDVGRMPAGVPPRIRQVVKLCLRKDPRERARDIHDVQMALAGEFDAGAPVAADTLPRPWWRLAAPAVAAASLAVVVTALAAWSLWPDPVPRPVNRFAYDLPEDQAFWNVGRVIMAVSPDGRSFVYNTTAGLRLRAMGDLAARVISGSESNSSNPFFSADGRSIGYFRGGRLKRIAATGGAPVVVAEATEPYGATWAPDDTILFGGRQGILRVPARGGTPALVVKAGDGEQVDSPQLLPDGEHVLFAVTTGTGNTRWDEAQIAVQSLRTTERTIVWQGGSAARYVPTGHLVYARQDALYAVVFDAESLAVGGAPVQIASGVFRPDSATATGAANFGLANDGSLVYVSGTSASSSRTLALVGLNGAVAELRLDPRQYLRPRLSPDGQRLVVQASKDGTNVLWIYDMPGSSQIRQLTFEGNSERPIWTPDGRRITFQSDRGGQRGLYWTPADGSGVPQQLTTAQAGAAHWPGSWSPDGRTLVFNVVGGPDHGIWALSVADRALRKLYGSSGTVYMGTELSADGRWLAYGAGPSVDAINLYVEPFPATGARYQVSQHGGYWPVWSRDGRRLFYRPLSSVAGIALRYIEIKSDPAFAFGPEQTLPIEGFSVVSFFRDYDVTPDGERLVMMFPAGRDDSSRFRFHIVQNWTEELRRLAPVE